MNKNVLIAFGGATLIALVVAMMLSAMLKGGHKKQQEVVEAAPQTQILVATKEIMPGQLLSEVNIKWKTWPQDALFPGTIERKEKQKPLEALTGRTIRTIAMDEPIVTTAIVSEDGGFLAAALEPGFRAVAVKVTAASMAGGFINPGDFVDIVLTYRVNVTARNPDETVQNAMQGIIDANIDRSAAETIVQNIKVLGVDQRSTMASGGKEEDASAKVGKTVTLQVTERQAEILALAQDMGDISLALRPLGDDKISAKGDPVVSDARLINMNKEVNAEMNKIAETTSSQNHNVRIYSGGAVVNIPTR